MIMQVYSVYDHAVGAYLQPFYVRSRGEAVRSFSEACNNAEHNFAKHASDFTLFYVSEFDDSSGTFVSGNPPMRIISALECVVVESPVIRKAEARDRVAM